MHLELTVLISNLETETLKETPIPLTPSKEYHNSC